MKLTFVTAGLFLAIGCASMYTGRSHTLCLKVVDSKTGDPVPGVSAVWREDLDDLLTGHYQTGPTNLALSNDSGIITITEVHKKMTGRFVLSHHGYHTMYGIYSDAELNLSEEIQPLPIPQDVFTLDDAQNVSWQKDGCFVIRLVK